MEMPEIYPWEILKQKDPNKEPAGRRVLKPEKLEEEMQKKIYDSIEHAYASTAYMSAAAETEVSIVSEI